MAIFGVVVEDEELPKQFFKDTKERLGTTHLAKNPFNGGLTQFISLKKDKDKTTLQAGYTIKMSPIYPNYAIFGALFLTVSCIIWFRIWLIIVTALFYLASMLWTGRFYYTMLKIGLKKKGYKGSIRYLKPSEILEEVYFNGNK